LRGAFFRALGNIEHLLGLAGNQISPYVKKEIDDLLKATAKSSRAPLVSSSSAKQKSKKTAVGIGIKKVSESSKERAIEFQLAASRALKYGDGIEWARGKTMIVGEGAAGKGLENRHS